MDVSRNMKSKTVARKIHREETNMHFRLFLGIFVAALRQQIGSIIHLTSPGESTENNSPSELF